MPDPRVPSVRARQLGRELRDLRTAAELTGEQVADRLGWSTAKVSRIESAKSSVTVADARRMLALYDVTEAQRERLLGLARSAGERGWWERYAESLRSGYTTFIGLENEAERVGSFRVGTVNGLLQTEAYSTAIARTVTPMVAPGEIERRVRVRLIRQAERLTGKDPLHLWTVLDESVLRRLVGGREVMREQLGFLLDVARQDNVTIQVLPFAAGEHAAVGAAPFSIFSFPGAILPDVVHVEEMTGDLFIESERQVFPYILALEEIRRRALSEAESRDFISSALAEL
ncbi:helix-turn-helix domain-containing protein [Actinomadura gamaensis]|uniref:Helix-turn-helix domain-containing protein n=1 Tax=Actinomadura gamaensis TaxID=1763541 RepID=A0ABV9U0N5_9ACTN